MAFGGKSNDEWDADRNAVQLANTRTVSFNEANLIRDDRSKVKRTDCFAVQFELAQDAKLGITTRVMEDKSLRIESLRPGGLFVQWNAASPDKEVAPGDRILEVNGPGTAEQLKWELRQVQFLNILIKPRDSAALFVHKVSDDYDVDPAVLAEGGFSFVFKATHRETHREYALKSYHKLKVESSAFEVGSSEHSPSLCRV
jgi:hypothetical protein